jgi:hypothetical protein
MTQKYAKEYPQFFHTLKIETERKIRSWWANKRTSEGIVVKTPEDLSLLYILVKEYQDFVEAQVQILANEVLTTMEKNNSDKIILGEYGKTVEYDKEARWLLERAINDEEWRKWNYDADQKYLKEKDLNSKK